MEDVFVHPSAVVDGGAIIGSDTRIWHFVHVSSGSRIGSGCVLGQNVYVASTAILGNNVRVQNNVAIYDRVSLEDDVFCGPSMVFTNVINPRSEVSRKDEFLPTVVKRGATLGANSTIVCGNTIGEYAFIGAGAVVTRDVKPFALIMGVPGEQVGWMSRAGIRLDLPVRGKAEATCPKSGDRYRLAEDELTLLE